MQHFLARWMSRDAWGQPRRRRRVPSIEPLQLAPRRKGIAALSLSENPNTRQTVYLRGSLRVISDVSDDEEEKKEEACDVTHMTEETNCILKLLRENETNDAQLYLGNLRDMQANLSLLIPQYLDNELILVELISLRETIDATLDAYAPIPEPIIRAVMKRSMGDLMLDLIEQDSESEVHDSTKELCDICYEEKPPETLPCGHTFCRSCIQQHLQVLLTEGKAFDMNCLAVGCDFTFTEETLEDYLTEKQFSRYQQFLLAAAIRADPNKKCCPKPNCEGVLVKNQDFAEQTEWPDHPYTECGVCESAICFLCIRDYHPDTTCAENEKSLRLRRLLTDEEDIRRWQAENDARPCPRCGTLIVKSEGCNHMRCRTCGENFCWICGVKGATEGHFNIPGRCFGQLFTEENNSTSDRALNMASYVLFLPILGPAFGLTSAIEEFQVQSKKMNRRLHGVDYTIVVTGTTPTELESLLNVYCSTTKPQVEDGLSTYYRSVSVSFVKCRLTLISIPPSELIRWMEDPRAKQADGFLVSFRSWVKSDLDDATILCDDIRKLLERPGVPGGLFYCTDKKKKSKKSDERVSKKTARHRASEHSLLLREVDPTRRWDLNKGFSSLLKRMLKRWEPTVQSIIED